MPEPSQTDRRQVLPKERDWRGRDPAVHSSPITQMGKTFDDITGVNAHKNQPAIEALAARGVIDGKSDGSFDPEGSMTRAEFAAIVVRALGLTPEGKNSFSDVAAEAWYAPYVGTAYSCGIITGVADDRFNPSGTITRQEAAVMVSIAQAVRTLEPQVNQLYPVTGGIIHSVLSTKEQKDGYRKLHIHGTKNCIEFCDSLMAGEISGSFIEMNMCTGACINGSAPLDRTVSRFRVKIDMEEKVSREPADRVKLQKMSEGVGLGKQYSDHSTNDLMPTEEQIREILAKTGKRTPEEELNCGACGYSTCREKAVAVFQKKAEINMCIPYMHDRAESLANLVMDTSPNLVMIVDGDMKILEYSAVGEKYFGKSRAEAIQMYLFEFIDTEDFQWVYATHQSIRGKKVSYPEYNLSALINIVYVEKKDVVLATIIDITEQESQARKYYEKKLNTVELAHEVIRKQMTVAQEIAGLLGETAAETKITLLDLCDSLLEEGEKEQGTGSGKRRRGTASAEPGSEAEGRR